MRRGQSTTEYLLTIAVIAIAIAAVMQVLSTMITSETAALGSSLAQSLSDDPVQ